jgi:bacteriorhodopsin
MIHLSPVGASILAVTTISMILFVMNAHNSSIVRWGAFIIAAAAVVVLAFGYRSPPRT